MGLVAAVTVGYLAVRGVLPLKGMALRTLTRRAAILAVVVAVGLQVGQWGAVAWTRVVGGWVHPYVPWWAVPSSLVEVSWVAILSMTVAAPIVEELVFRGVVYSGLRRQLGVPAGVAISAILFAAVHPGGGLLFVLLLGVVAVVLYERTGSLWSAITTHAAFNGFVIVAGVLLHTVGDIPGMTLA